MKKRIISILLAVCMMLCLAPTSVFAEGTGDVAINEINFPDENFRNFVSSNYDKSGSGVLSAEKIAGITEIFCSEEEIESLQGIEFFTALEELCCFDNNLTSLDVSSNTALKHLECYNNNLTDLNVSNNAALEFLSCYNNSLTSLNVSNNTALVTLYCGENSLTSLNVSNNTVLETLSFFLNSLTDMDISKNTALKELNCGCNSLTTLDIRNNTALERLWCQENNLTTLDVSRNTALTMLYCWENNLTSLDVSGLSLGDWDFYAEGNIYNIRDAVGTGRTFDLSTLPGNFDVNKASNWNGGTVAGTTLTINDGVYTVTYTYDCGEGKTEVFSLTTLQNITSIETIVTAPVIGEKSADSATCVTAPENAAEFRNLVWDKIAEEDFTGTYWFDTWTPMAENETFQSGYYYRVKLCFDAKEDFGFFKNVTGKVNGKDHNGTYGDIYNFEDSSYACLCAVYKQLHVHDEGDEYAYDENSHWKQCAECGTITTEKVAHTPDHIGHATEEYAIKCTVCDYEIEAQLAPTQKITSIEATVKAPVLGEEPDYSATAVTVPENGVVFDELFWYKIAKKDFTGTYDDEWDEMSEGEKFELGYYYSAEIFFYANEGFSFTEAVTGKVNGRDHDDTYGDEYVEGDDVVYLSIVYEPLHIHEAGDEYAYDKNSHWNTCTQCDEKMNVAEHTFTWVTDKEATATEKGSKHEECTVCGYEKAAVEIPATGITPDYKIIDGANGAWKQNSDGTLTFRANGDFSNFVGVKVDGVLIDASNYTAVSGSTVITLKTDYLKALSVGTHTLTVVYNDGECSTNFEIKTSQSQNTGTTPTESNTPTTPSDADKTNPDTGATSPQTGDNSTMGLWFALLFVSGFGIIVTTIYSKKKRVR